MDIFEILLYVLVIASIVAVGFLIAILYRVNVMLARAERVMVVVEHIKDGILAFENLPALILKKITKHFFGK